MAKSNEVMTEAMAKIWARRIYAGTRSVDEVQERYGVDGVEMVKVAYYKLYGEEL